MTLSSDFSPASSSPIRPLQHPKIGTHRVQSAQAAKGDSSSSSSSSRSSLSSSAAEPLLPKPLGKRSLTFHPHELISAAANGRFENFQALVEHGMNVNLRSDSGRTPLMLALDRGHHQIVHYLLEHRDINISLANERGETAILVALSKKNADALNQMFDKQPEAFDARHKDAIHNELTRALREGESDWVNTLGKFLK